LKRSNRLVLLVGVFLAIVAFIGILLLQSGQTPTSQEPAVPTELPTVIATQDIPLGTAIRADQVTTEVKSVDARDVDAFGDTSQVIGKIVRQPVVAGAAITATTLSGGQQGQILDIQCPPTQRCMAVQVDQVSGVGTVIKTGDYVDMVVGFNVAVLSPDAAGTGFQVVPGIDGTTVKLILQGLQVMGTLLPPPTTAAAPPPEGQPAASPGTVLSGQQEIVILSVSAQQAEVIKFAQLKASEPPSGITLVLRSASDFIDPATNLPFPNGPVPDTTSGIIFRVLVEEYGVLPPNIIEVVLPTPEAS
jgi:Flp pilus assembly protein CpaB